MRILVVGCGRLGSLLAEYLESDGHEVNMVDNRSGAFHRLPAEFKGKTVLGNGIDQDVLREAKAEDSDILIVATDSDNTNIMAALVGQKILHIPRVLARIYDQTRTASYQNYGIETFSPTELVAGLMRDSIRKGN